MTEPAKWEPAFPGQRPPFTPGHELSMRSGYKSPRKIAPLAKQFLEAVLNDDAVPYLREPRYGPALVAWSSVEAQVALLADWVAAMPLADAADAGPGRASPLELLRKWEQTAMTHRDRLGLTPMAAARLGRDVAATRVDTAHVMAELHRLEQEQLAPGDGS